MSGAKNKTAPDVPAEVREELGNLAVSLKGLRIAEMAYDYLLTEDERQRITKDRLARQHIANLFAELRGITVTRTVLDVAYGLGILVENRYRYLLRILGEPNPTPRGQKVPQWNGAICKLFYKGKLVRKVRSRKVACNIVAILNEFEKRGWPARIDSPLVGWKDPQRLREAIASLNRGLKRIRFRADGSGQGVLWERR